MCGLAVSRQNGKNAVIEVRELFGMIANGEKFLHTAHEVKTAKKAFKRIASFFENERLYPELAALVVEIRKTNGQEAIVLSNGGSTEFIARSRGSGRGFTVDVLVCDEAQELTNDELEALLPTISAAPLGDPQVIFTGTPPEQDSESERGEAFVSLRQAGESNSNPRLAWTDFGVPDGPCPDVNDRDLWFAHNPSLGGRLHVEVVENELTMMKSNPEGFAKERLGWWGDPQSAGSAISALTWGLCADRTDIPPRPEGKVAFAVDSTPDRDWTSISVAGVRPDGVPQVQVVDRNKGTTWAVARVKELQATHDVCAVVIDRASAASSLVDEFTAAGVEVVVTASQDMVEACGQFYDAVTEQRLRHLDQPELNAAVLGATKRVLEASWAWNRKKTTVDITPLVSSTLALWGWTTRHASGDILSAVW